VTSDWITTDRHDAYPRTIRTVLGNRVRHLRLEQDHRGIKGRCRPMLGFVITDAASRFCRVYDELRGFLRSRSRMRQHVPAATQRHRHMRRTAIALGILEAA
jgi:transposase-like protein